MQKRVRDFILVGIGTVVVDFLFHTYFTSPQEVPLYFLAKFAWAALASYLVVTYFSVKYSVFQRGVIGGAIFDLLVGLYYAAAYYTQNPALSCCFINAPAVTGIPQVTYAMLAYYPITSNVLAFVAVHFLAFFAAHQVVYRYT